MNYQHANHDGETAVAERVASVVQRQKTAEAERKAADAERVAELNRLTRYPSFAALAVSAAALLSAIVHYLK